MSETKIDQVDTPTLESESQTQAAPKKVRKNKGGAGRPKLAPGEKGAPHNPCKPDKKIQKRMDEMQAKLVNVKMKDYLKCKEISDLLNAQLFELNKRLAMHHSDPTLEAAIANASHPSNTTAGAV